MTLMGPFGLIHETSADNPAVNCAAREIWLLESQAQQKPRVPDRSRVTTPGRGLCQQEEGLPPCQRKHILKAFGERLLAMELGKEAVTQIPSKSSDHIAWGSN